MTASTEAPKLRVLQIIETGGPGGAETVFAQLASGLREAGHHVYCLVGHGSWLPAELQRRGFSPELIPRERGSAATFVSRVVAMVRRERIDVIHAHLFDGAMYAAIAGKLSGVPVVATLHGQVDLRHGGAKQWAKHFIFRSLVTRAVAVSHALQRDLQPALRLGQDRFSVVHNGIERRPLATGAAATEAENTTGRAAGTASSYRLVALGNIRTAKDYPSLLRAVRILRDRGFDVVLDIAGQPDTAGLYDQLLMLREELQLEDRVVFHGFVADPSALLRKAHLFVLASSQEGFSLATIEAMLAGVPVVATRSGGPEEIITDQQTGMLIPPQSPDSLATAVAELLQDEPRRARLAAAASSEVTHRFSVAAMVGRYAETYGACLLGP